MCKGPVVRKAGRAGRQTQSGQNLGYTERGWKQVKTDGRAVPSWEEPHKKGSCPTPTAPGQQEVAEMLETGRRSDQMCVSEISSHILCGQETDKEERYKKGQEQPRGACVDSTGSSDCRPKERTSSTNTQQGHQEDLATDRMRDVREGGGTGESRTILRLLARPGTGLTAPGTKRDTRWAKGTGVSLEQPEAR